MQPVGMFEAPTSGQGMAGGLPSLNGQSFLQLLTQEIQNQDPTQPMSSTDFMQQLTSLTEMSVLTQVAQAQQVATMATESSAAVSLLGKSVTVMAGSGSESGTVSAVTATSSGEPSLTVNLPDGTSVETPLSSVTGVQA